MDIYVDKLSDVIKVGDEFTTDDGIQMLCVGYDENGEVIAKRVE